jgi:nucleoside 2-deoxyribosyltransferase
MRAKTVYLAGPEVFLPEAVDMGARKKALCEKYGFEGLFPLDNEIGAAPGGDTVDRLIYDANFAMIQRADFGVFNLTPFRGVGADPGTVFELGAMIALGKPALGYSNDADDLLARTRRAFELSCTDGVWRDEDGLSVEDFGAADNLMIDAALARGGFPLLRRAAPPERRLRDLEAFEACLMRAQAAFAAAP